MTIIESLYDYFKTCPLLEDGRKLNISFLPADKREYAISVIPTAKVVKTFIDGSSMMCREGRIPMSNEILVALIVGGLELAGVIITVLASSKKTEQHIRVSQAVTDTKLDELTREVREHNGFARRMPVVEEQIKVINHRIEDLERMEEK